jgi:hypothetical protein
MIAAFGMAGWLCGVCARGKVARKVEDGVNMQLERVKVAASLPRPDAAADCLSAWIEIVGENVECFGAQCIVEAERGDVEAALYADSAREFAQHTLDNLVAIRAAILGIASTATSIAAGVYLF